MKPQISITDVAKNLRNYELFCLAWSKYYNLYDRIKGKYNNPPIHIPKGIELKQPEIKIPECLKGKVGFNHEIAPYYLEAKCSLSEKEELLFQVLEFRQKYGEEEWIDHNTPEPSRLTQSEIERIDQEFKEVLVEMDSLRDEMKYYFNDEWKNMDVCRFHYITLLSKAMRKMYKNMGGISIIVPYKVTNYKSCKSLVFSDSYKERNTDPFRNTNYDPERFYWRITTENLFQKASHEPKRPVIAPVSETAKPSEQQKEKIQDKVKDRDFPLYKKTPKNAKWQDLTMAFPNHLEDKVDICFKGKQKETVFLNDLGFSDKKATIVFKPLESLILLKRFAKFKNNSILSPKDKTERTTLHAQVESLRNTLKRCFGIGDNPVPANEEGGYHCLFKVYCYDIKEKEELETYLENLREHFRGLRKEASNTGSYRDKDRITELKQLIEVCAKEIVQRNPVNKLKDAICTGCYEKIPTCILNSDNIQILCNDCTPESTNEYKSKTNIDYKDNDITRSG